MTLPGPSRTIVVEPVELSRLARAAARATVEPVLALAETSLTDDERRVVERLVELIRGRFGGRLRSIWLYGSRARGERPGPESDIDLLVIADPAEEWDDVLTALLLVDRAANELELERPIVSIKVHNPEWLRGRRQIEAFFIREVDRDKVVLHGDP